MLKKPWSSVKGTSKGANKLEGFAVADAYTHKQRDYRLRNQIKTDEAQSIATVLASSPRSDQGLRKSLLTIDQSSM